jgi:hypothetical protein
LPAPTALCILPTAPRWVSPRRGGRVWLNAAVSKASHRIRAGQSPRRGSGPLPAVTPSASSSGHSAL